ncbi:hypothetical protein BMI90_12880 [Thioclava sp. L04-15]|uniref:trypsin-like serine peptidase n=1 Tax=Thioclava sp. L04-15 TaxID=1915318 RepID=UPI0009D00935|nr:trypsin-like peptidase domain-containing protein [Thioclava sp. L04-15]OOY27493.1 hypothetical protein BMI90_12880 [Thioclava sp. L04-15]TNE93018.1 MAG: trypsin-like serine protease [Paracoccaceae bacterium]
MRITGLIAGVLFVGLLGSAAQAESSLDRLSQRADLFGWEAVGKVAIGEGGFCTGVLIAPDLVLTAGHCIFDRSRNAARPPSEIRFLAGQTGDMEIAAQPVARMVADPDYAPFVPISAETVRHDVALLQLARPIPSSVAAPFRVGTVGPKGTQVSVVSYARGRADMLSWQKSCSVFGRGEGLVGFDCDVNHGSSGAPVFDRSGVAAGERARVVSLVSAGSRKDGEVRAYGMELPAIVETLKSALRSGRGVIEGTSPQAQAPAPSIRSVGQTGSGTRVLSGGSASGAKFLRP